MKRIKAIHAFYRPLMSRRKHHEILGWSSEEAQQARFRVLIDHVPLSGRKLLDVGCGLGDLLTLLKREKLDVDYTGVDLLEDMVRAARTHHGEDIFHHTDIFQADPFGPKSFDVVYCSGIFNLNLDNNMAFLVDAVRKFCELACQIVAFNLLHARAADNDDRYFYYEPQEVVRSLGDWAGRTSVVDDYLHGDFTVLCRLADEK